MDKMAETVKRKWCPVPLTDVVIEDVFWLPRIRTNRERTLPFEYEQCKDTGRIDAFRLDWTPGKEPRPHEFWDSDVAKWVEAASYSLSQHPDQELENLLETVIDLIVSAQQPDGYLNTYFTVVEPQNRWRNLGMNHELYSAGHLFEAAVAHYESTGKRKLLDAMCRYADYIGEVFGRGVGQRRGYCGHEEIELALVKLYRATNEERYLRLAQYFVDERGQEPNYFEEERLARGEAPHPLFADSYAYAQAHIPVREQSEVVGHAVRAMYLYCAMTDLAGEIGDESLLRACDAIWNNLCAKQLYLTGGIGSSRHNEGFTTDYDLPNETAYAETCAAIGFVMWNHRMLQLNCDGKYADMMERALYNGVISGVSLDGERFFYENPLASTGAHHRKPWFGCACCPPNIARLLASFGTYVYSSGDEGIAVHLYAQGHADIRLAERKVTIEQEHEYPWSGRIALTIRPDQPAAFALKLRIPEWCKMASLSINGAATAQVTGADGREDRIRAIGGDGVGGDTDSIPPGLSIHRGYLAIDRVWHPGDVVELALSMPVERIYSHPRVTANIGRVALQRGPLVYCLEHADNGPRLQQLALPADAVLEARFEPELLGGIVVLDGTAMRLAEDGWDGRLYGSGDSRPAAEPALVRAIPYAYWDNREGGEMLVWLREMSK
ncbi:glycoside hydrolase family 127 protein [Paenibacillus sp. GCM10027626]|uniref:glycoside hydrolase family 127 protein n=1 Tax=Paenibacillus sp. GCM10027626 TaxID=3273411 RepID=UPI003625246E